ncbi:MAG: sulfatase [Planctomycetota bacterium]|nr:sulfatase [Planctomycetota bacterium]
MTRALVGLLVLSVSTGVVGSLLLNGCGGEVSADESPRPPSVVLVAVDGLRADQVGAYSGVGSTPNLDDLAAHGLRYSDVSTPTPWSAPALAALLSGRYPSALGWTDLEAALPYDVELLSELLAEEGYRTAAIVNHRFVAGRFNLDQGFEPHNYMEVGLPPEGATDDDVFPPSGAQVTGAALTWLDAVGDDPFFLLVHYADALPPWDLATSPIDPHYQGPIANGLSYRDLMRLSLDLTGADQQALMALYDAAVAGVDVQVGRLLEGLEGRGRDEDTFVCVVGISGLELGEHGELGTAKRLYEELLHVPWILTGPGVEPGVLQDASSLIDVTPTLLDLIGAPGASRADGLVMLPELGTPDRILISETDRARSLRAVVDGRWKLIHDHETGTSELYDLVDDPGETQDLASARPKIVRTLEALLFDWEKSCEAE